MSTSSARRPSSPRCRVERGVQVGHRAATSPAARSRPAPARGGAAAARGCRRAAPVAGRRAAARPRAPPAAPARPAPRRRCSAPGRGRRAVRQHQRGASRQQRQRIAGEGRGREQAARPRRCIARAMSSGLNTWLAGLQELAAVFLPIPHVAERPPLLGQELGRMRGTCSALTITRCQSVAALATTPPRSDRCGRAGVDINTGLPALVANIGRTALYSVVGTRAPRPRRSSAGRREAAHRAPRRPAGDSMREPLPRRRRRGRCPALSAGAGSSRPRNSANFLNSSPAWRRRWARPAARASPAGGGRRGGPVSRPWSTCPPGASTLSSTPGAASAGSRPARRRASNPSRSRAKATGSSAWRRARADLTHGRRRPPPPPPRAPPPPPAWPPGACPARAAAPPGARPARRRRRHGDATLPSPNMPRCCTEQPQRAQLVDTLQAHGAAVPVIVCAHLGDDRRLLVGQLGRGTQLHPARPPAHHPPRVAERDAGQLEHHPVGRHLGPAAARGLRLGDRGRDINIRQQPRPDLAGGRGAVAGPDRRLRGVEVDQVLGDEAGLAVVRACRVSSHHRPGAGPAAPRAGRAGPRDPAAAAAARPAAPRPPRDGPAPLDRARVGRVRLLGLGQGVGGVGRQLLGHLELDQHRRQLLGRRAHRPTSSRLSSKKAPPSAAGARLAPFAGRRYCEPRQPSPCPWCRAGDRR